jgi:hypothetical protein
MPKDKQPIEEAEVRPAGTRAEATLILLSFGLAGSIMLVWLGIRQCSDDYRSQASL